jgi:glycosyltransferase involved in cell wall biosynthesis
MKTKPITLVHITTVPESLAFVTGQVGYMKARGFEIVGLSSPGELLTRFAECEGVPVHAVEMPRRVTPWRDVLAVLKLVRLLRRIRPQIVHAHTPKGGLLGMLSAWIARTPVRIYHMHGLPFVTATGWTRRLLMWSERISCGLADQVLCVSSSARALAVEAGLCRADKVKVLLQGSVNGVDAVDRFNPANVPPSARNETRLKYGIPADAAVLGFIGRIVRSKGLVDLAKAWGRLRADFPALHLLLVGPLEPQDPIPRDVEASLRKDSRVHLIGEEWDTPPLYAAMDLLVLPTYREGLPGVLLEAAAMQVPVVATNVTGCVDVVQDGVTGALIPPYDSERLATAIRRYLQDPELRRRHGVAARDRVLREFRPEEIWQAIYEEYLELLEEKGIPAFDAGIAATLAEKGLVALSHDRTMPDQLGGQGFDVKETEAVNAGGFRPSAGPS